MMYVDRDLSGVYIGQDNPHINFRPNRCLRCLPKQVPLKLRAEPVRDLLSTYSSDAKSVTSCPTGLKQGRLARYEEMAKFKTRYVVCTNLRNAIRPYFFRVFALR